jgi:hypothetical protein
MKRYQCDDCKKPVGQIYDYLKKLQLCKDCFFERWDEMS